MNKIIISDPSLRDGNHAVKHSISIDSIERYCRFAESAGIPIVEVGHGNGLGASSLLIGLATVPDDKMLEAAPKNLIKSKLGIHIIPGLATINKDIARAIDIDVNIFRVACHCTEATITKSHINYLASKGKTVYGTLMMASHVTSVELMYEAKKMHEYGAEAVIIMDSTGTFMPDDVYERVDRILNNVVNLKVGFHAHNNLGLSVANSLSAARAGGTIIDACIRGFGAGAGNTPLEVIIPVLEKNGFSTGIDFSQVIKAADEVPSYLVKNIPVIDPINILTGLNKLFSGFEKPIIKASKLFGIEYSALIFELGNRKLVAGQEDLIMETAQKLKNHV